jgi:hypothetical protein
MSSLARDRWQVEGVREANPVERQSMLEWRGPLHPAKRLACGVPYAPRRSSQPPKNCSQAKSLPRGRRHRCDESNNHSPASSDVLRERLSDSCRDRAHLAQRAVKRLGFAGPHPRSRCSSTSLVAAAAGATGPGSDFSGRCDRDCGADALHLPLIAAHAKPGRTRQCAEWRGAQGRACGERCGALGPHERSRLAGCRGPRHSITTRFVGAGASRSKQ